MPKLILEFVLVFNLLIWIIWVEVNDSSCFGSSFICEKHENLGLIVVRNTLVRSLN